MGMGGPDNNTDDAFVPPVATVNLSACPIHPYRASIGGGICASCLKEKLGKLLSLSSASSFPIHLHRPTSSSSSSNSSSARSPPSTDLSSSSTKPNNRGQSLWSGIPGFLYLDKKKKRRNRKCHIPAPAASDRAAGIAFRRSNTTPKRPEHLSRSLDEEIPQLSPRKKGFWSYFSSSGPGHPRRQAPNNTHLPSSATTPGRRSERTFPFPNDMPERKVSRSRSVGCSSGIFGASSFSSSAYCKTTGSGSGRRPRGGNGRSRGGWGGFTFTHLLQ